MSKTNTPVVTIIQTRRGSSRLPGKVLMPLAGRPLFVRQAERVKASKLCGTVVIATTTDAQDDIIEQICNENKLECFRGDTFDLLDRHYKAALKYNASVAVKIPSDCPLIDSSIIDKVIGYFIDNKDEFDYVSNLHPATYPDGNDVEVMHIDALQNAWVNASRPFEREHTTPYIWEHPQEFNIGNVTMGNDEDLSMTHRFTIDYKEDYEFINEVYNELYPQNPLFTMEDILQLLDRKKNIFSINSALAGINWYRNHLNELTTIDHSQTKIVEQA